MCVRQSTIDVRFFQAEDGIRDVERSRGLGDVYKRQLHVHCNDLYFRFDRKKTLSTFQSKKNYDRCQWSIFLASELGNFSL